ncbi:MAG: AI-2E family transporter [Anaerolineae bacterium]|nr:AI-2E family transporter [Anaerolineae bacterium]
MQSSSGRVSLGEYTLRALVTLLVIVILLALWRLRDAFMLTFLAVIVAIALYVPVRRLERMGLSRGVSVLIAMTGLIAVLVLAVVLIVPIFVEQVGSLIDNLPDAFDQARDEYDWQADHHDWLPKIDWDQVTQGDVPDFVVNQASNLSRNIFPFLSGIGGVLANTIFILFIALFFVTDPTNYLEGLLTLVPHGYRPRAFEIFVDLGETLQRWFIGQLISMTLLGTLIALVMGLVMGLPNPVALGVIAGVLEFVPNFGSFASVIPAVLIALADDPGLTPWVILAYLVTQQVQSNIIMPRIMARQISMPSAMVLIAQVIAAALFGFMGLVLAVPLAVVAMVLIREVYVYDVLNTRPAQIETRLRPDGAPYPVVVSELYRPPQLSPGEAARLQAQGQDPFEAGEGQVVEIITPPSPALEQAVRGQQAVWAAILTLAAAQALALVRSLLNNREG